jgi:hypothetical protein
MATRKAFLLRIDPRLWEAIERLAQAELRSANAQVEFMLRESLAQRGALPRVTRVRPKHADEEGEP